MISAVSMSTSSSLSSKRESTSSSRVGEATEFIDDASLSIDFVVNGLDDVIEETFGSRDCIIVEAS